MEDLFDLIARLAAVHGPSGREQAVAQAIAELARPYADEVTADVMGNVIVHRKGSGPRLMLTAHMDTVGVVATYLEPDGTVRFGRLGREVGPKDLRNALVRFEGGSVTGAVKVYGAADEDKLAIDDLYLDIGAESREEAKQRVRLGDTAAYTGLVIQAAGRRVMGPNLSRAACASLLKTLERLKTPQNDLWVVFTVQGELGYRGAKTAVYAVEPDYAVTVDMAPACDWPSSPKAGTVKLGGGPAVKLMDVASISHPAMVDRLTSLAEKEGGKFQRDIRTRGGSDMGVVAKNHAGVIAAGISISRRYAYTPTELVDLSDVDACAQLLLPLVEQKL